jgi:hypothetical protein
MATKPPNIKKSQPVRGNPNQPDPRIIDNPPASSAAKALANARKQVESAK